MMIDVTSPCPIMIYEIEIDELLIAHILCLLEAGFEIRLPSSGRWKISDKQFALLSL
jgi:hypothetical protein